MTTTVRTDVHRPSADEFDPEGYTCYGVFDLFPEASGDLAAFQAHRQRVQMEEGLRERGIKRAGHQHLGQCGHCGARIRYAALMVNEEVGEYIHVGETCLDNRFDLTKGEFQALRKAAALNRERTAKAEKMAALLAEHPVLVWASYAHNIDVAGGVECYRDYNGEEHDTAEQAAEADKGQYGETGYYSTEYKRGTTWGERTRTGWETSTLGDIWWKVEKYGDPSEKQVRFVESLVARLSEAEERLAQREAERDVKVAAGAVLTAGRQTVEGVVRKITWKSNDFGGAWKVTVEQDNGTKVWGSLPSSLAEFDFGQEQTMVGKRIRFDAKVEPKDDDPTFGFYTRPTKAEEVSA